MVTGSDPLTTKIPPQSLEAERAVLGVLLAVAPREILALLRDGAVLGEIGMDDHERRAQPDRSRHRDRGAHAEGSRLVAGRRDDAALVGVAADDNGQPAQRRVVALLDGRVERIHVEMDDLADVFLGHQIAG